MNIENLIKYDKKYETITNHNINYDFDNDKNISANNTLLDFMNEHEELNLKTYTKTYCGGYDWSVIMEGIFSVKIEGIYEYKNLIVTWQEDGSSQVSFDNFTIKPNFKVSIDDKMHDCIAMRNKWYVLTSVKYEEIVNIAKENNYCEEIIEIYEEKIKTYEEKRKNKKYFDWRQK